MENWININQLRSYEWGLNSTQEKLCAYYSREHNWVTNRIKEEDGDYLSICLSKLIYELPTIGKIKSTFSRALNSLVQKKVFEKKISSYNKREIFYRFNPKFLQAWRDNNKVLASCLKTKEILLIDNKCCKNTTDISVKDSSDTSVAPKQQVLQEDNSRFIQKEESIDQKELPNVTNTDISVLKEIQNTLKLYGEAIENIYKYIEHGTSVALEQPSVALEQSSVALEQSSVALEQSSVAPVQTISINNQINKSNKHHHKKEEEMIDVDDDKNFKDIKKEKDIQEFEQILNLYPETINNTKDKKIEAFKVFRTFNPAQRLNLYKAVINYANSENVKNQTTNKYIKSIHTFLTKSYIEFIDVQEKYDEEIKLNEKSSSMGEEQKVERLSKEEVVKLYYRPAEIEEMKKYALKVKQVKLWILETKDEKTVESRAKDIFTPFEWELFFVKCGGFFRINEVSIDEWGEGIYSAIKEAYECFCEKMYEYAKMDKFPDVNVDQNLLDFLKVKNRWGMNDDDLLVS